MAGDLGNTGALCIFALVLLAYTLQTELAQIVQQSQGYRKPYFLFYMTHSGYILLAPLHLAGLRILNIPVMPSLYTLRDILALQFAPPSSSAPDTPAPPGHRPSYSRSLSRASLPTQGDERPGPRRRTSMKRLLRNSRAQPEAWMWKMARIVLALSTLIAIPALSWYAAMPLTAVTDVTAIYNCFAFWAYLLAIRFLGELPSRAKLASVVVAVVGVFVIAYGDSWAASGADEGGEEGEGRSSLSRFIGNMLAFGGSISYAYYEVWYKINVSLPDPEDGDDLNDDDELEAAETLLAGGDEAVFDADAEDGAPARPASLASHASRMQISSPPPAFLQNASATTFLLYSNLITSLIGLTTLTLFWIPIPILHFIGWEDFQAPPSETWLLILGIVLSGVCFNAGFMILLSLWGPVVASVGNLCTLVLVAIADTLVPNSPPLSLATIVGSGLIVASFAGLIVGARREAQLEHEKVQQLKAIVV